MAVFYYIHTCMNIWHIVTVYHEFNNNIYVCTYFIIHILTDIIRDSIKPYCDKDVGKFATIVAFDCRGIEPVDFSPRVSLSV